MPNEVWGTTGATGSPHGQIFGDEMFPVLLADHVKNLGWQARRVVFEAKATTETLTDVRERLRVLLGL